MQFIDKKTQSLSPILRLSIIIVNYKAQDYLGRCLSSIKRNLKGIDHEVIVVDNASDKEIIEAIHKDFPETYLIVNAQNLGFSKAVNQGIKISKGEYILLLNNDTEVPPASLQVMLRVMGQFPSTGVLGCLLMNSDHTIQESYGMESGFFSEIIRKLFLNILFKNSRRFWGKLLLQRFYSSDKEVDWVCGACAVFNRKALYDVGLLNENYFMYYEDRDVCNQLKRKGWDVRFTPKASIIHHHGRSASKAPIRSARAYRQSQLFFYKKNGGSIGFWLLKNYLYFKFSLNLGICFFKRMLIFKNAKDQTNFNREMLKLVRSYD
jgi:hypothetical protein